MNLLSLISSSPLYTLHSHTQYCDGRASMEEFAQRAVEMGFDVYGFTPHSPVPFKSSCNMEQEDVPKYMAEVKSLQEKYPSVHFLTGMEIDYISADWGPATNYFKELDLDFRIGSVHFIPSQDGEIIDIDGRYESFKEKMTEYFHNDIRYVVDTFFQQSLEMLQAGHFDIVGHFDKIKHNGGLYHPGLEEEPWYQTQVVKLIDVIIDTGVIVEINTKAWQQHQQLFPSQRHWKKLIEAGVPIVVNSDAHYPKLINASRKEVLNALEYLKDKVKNHKQA